MKNDYPSRIVCLTEESVETLYHIGKLDLVKGVSAFVKRPEHARNLPKVSLFTSSKIDKICELRPDLVLGFSDIQKDIASELIGRGLNVYIANHRSVAGILDYIGLLGRMTNAPRKTQVLIERIRRQIEKARNFSSTLATRPRVYFEEWDSPMISAIQWVSEIVELCGGIDVNKELSQGVLAKERFVDPLTLSQKNPDIILGCWCGKKVKLDSFKKREHFAEVNAVRNSHIYEVEPEIFLQPGPAPFLDGIDVLIDIFSRWNDEIME